MMFSISSFINYRPRCADFWSFTFVRVLLLEKVQRISVPSSFLRRPFLSELISLSCSSVWQPLPGNRLHSRHVGLSLPARDVRGSRTDPPAYPDLQEFHEPADLCGSKVPKRWRIIFGLSLDDKIIFGLSVDDKNLARFCQL